MSPDDELLIERSGDVAQRASALVTVQADVAAGDVLLGDAALARSGDTHHEDDVAIRAAGPRARRDALRRRFPARRRSTGAPLRVRRSVPSRGGWRQGSQRRRGKARAARERGLGQAFTREAAGPARATERRVSDHGDARLLTAFDNPSSNGGVVVDAESYLHRRDGGQLERLVQPPPVDVGHADALGRGPRRRVAPTRAPRSSTASAGSGAWMR